MSIRVTEVRTKQQLRAFIHFPDQLYAGNPCYVPPLKADEWNTLTSKNPAFAFCTVRLLLAERDGTVVGRVAGIINRNEIKHEESSKLRFGWLDFVDDPAVSAALLHELEQWARQAGVRFIEGPVGFTNFDKAGMLTFGFDELSNMVTIYNAPYYPEHLSLLGFEAHKNWVEYEFQVPDPIPERYVKAADMVRQRYGLRTVPLHSKKEMRRFANEVFELIEITYRDNYDYIAFTPEQRQYYLRQFMNMLPPEYLCVVANAEGQLVGFAITMPSVVRALQRSKGKLFPFGWWHLWRALRRPERGELLLIGVQPAWRNKGINALIFPEIISNFHQKGIKVAESNPELEDNTAVQALWKQADSRQHKRRVIFAKWL